MHVPLCSLWDGLNLLSPSFGGGREWGSCQAVTEVLDLLTNHFTATHVSTFCRDAHMP